MQTPSLQPMKPVRSVEKSPREKFKFLTWDHGSEAGDHRSEGPCRERRDGCEVRVAVQDEGGELMALRVHHWGLSRQEGRSKDEQMGEGGDDVG